MKQRTQIVDALLAWFGQNARDLPWRRTQDPYAIWVSEIMLQQTQVKTVLPYWERWMRALPSVQDLAQADEQKLHKLWEGLGYYTRVRNLQRAARQVVEKHQGVFPADYEQVLALPGVGSYTAGAVCSIAYNQPKPILDGNVVRVLTRVFGIRGNPRDKKVNQRLWELAEELVTLAAALREAERPCSHLNQSLMELGALVCTPRDPACDKCPVRAGCAAARLGLTGQIPALPRRPRATARHFLVFVLTREGRFLAQQRPAGVVNARLWEFPTVEAGGAQPDPRAVLEDWLQGKLGRFAPLCTIKHTITRYRITSEAYLVETEKRTVKPGRWLTMSQLRQLPFSSAHRKILDRLPGCGNRPG